MKEQEVLMIPASENGNYITLDELYKFCGIPGTCNREMEWEGKYALVTGYISYINVKDKREYTWLPHGKFLVYNAEHNINVDIWVDSDDADKIFNKIIEHRSHPDDPVYIRGQLVGVDLPTMRSCQRNVLIFLFDAESIFIGTPLGSR